MSLLTFSKQPIRPDLVAKPAPSPNHSFPLTIIYPPDAQIAVPATWRRLPTGQIEATYHDYDELYWSVNISKWLQEWATEPLPVPEQASLPLCAPSNKSTYYRKG